MTKAEVMSKMSEAAGDSKYGKEVIAEFNANFNDDDKKYGQTIKDRLDDRLGEVEGWIKRDDTLGKGNPEELAEHVEVLKKMIASLE